MTLHLTPWSRMWTFQLLGFGLFQFRLQKKKPPQPFQQNGAIFDRLKINLYFQQCIKTTKLMNI
jgi:hypothetical protein